MIFNLILCMHNHTILKKSVLTILSSKISNYLKREKKKLGISTYLDMEVVVT